MTRMCERASWVLGSLGAALLVVSIVLVPQSRALADEPEPAPLVCKTDPIYYCDPLSRCFVQFPSCPETDTSFYCHQTDPQYQADCKDCHCKFRGSNQDCVCKL